MQRPGLRPRSNLWPDSIYLQGHTGYASPTLTNVGGGYGNSYFMDGRLIVFYAPNRPVAPSTSIWHQAGYRLIHQPSGGGWGWYAYWAWHFEQPPLPSEELQPDYFPFSGGSSPTVVCVQAVTKVDPIQPVFPQGTPFGPGVARVNNTLSWGVPGYDHLPSGQYLLIHVNACWYEGWGQYFVTYPTNPGMTRFFNYRHDARGWGDAPAGEGEWTMIQRGLSFNVDYAWIGGEYGDYSWPATTKSFGPPNSDPNGPRNADYCTTFYCLLRGVTPSATAATHSFLGGPVPA